MKLLHRACVVLAACLLVLGFGGCAAFNGSAADQTDALAVNGEVPAVEDYDYLIGPGDTLQIFVWRNPEVSVEDLVVRPDGKITAPLVEDLVASGKTPAELARAIEKRLELYIRKPIVTVIVGGFSGSYAQQVRVIGEAAEPRAIPYRSGMSLLDVMITVGGLTEFAAGNRAAIIRTVDGQQRRVPVRVEDLLEGGDITANVSMLPGDVLIVPESWL